MFGMHSIRHLHSLQIDQWYSPHPAIVFVLFDYTVSVHVRAINLLHWLCVSHIECRMLLHILGIKAKKELPQPRLQLNRYCLSHSSNTRWEGAALTLCNVCCTDWLQKGRKRVALSKGESTSSKRRKDETPASCRPSRGRAQSAKWTPGLTPATPATEIARFNCRADTTYAKSGVWPPLTVPNHLHT